MRKLSLSRAFTVLVMVAFLPLFVLAQGKVSGKITDGKNGTPLAGATVTVKGTNRGTTTDAEGKFTLTANATDMLVVEYMGFKKMEISAGSDLSRISLEQGDASSLGAVTVVGSRKPGRSSTQTISPVDIIDIAQVTNQVGQVDINQLLQFAAPSFNANRQAGSDGSDHIDAATLRGLGADQVLVLINGKRRHTASLINLFGSRSRGNVGTDLNTIPVSAIERIEVLRDGASAQYGSDAIAGVINIVLKTSTGKGEASINGGIYSKGDGQSLLGNVNYGWKTKKGGFINASGEISHRGKTNRAPDDNKRQIGDARINNGSLFINGATPMNASTEFYYFGGLNYRDGSAGAWYRSPDDDRNVPEIYPNGFVPEIKTRISDQSINMGIRKKVNGWTIDLSNTYGHNKMHYFVHKTLNASLLAASPTKFDAGGFAFGQNTLNLGFTRNFPVLAGLNLAFGAEYRKDRYSIFAGETGSYYKYGLVNTFDAGGNPITVDTNGKPGGAQGFPGFRPANELDKSRTNFAGYLDVEFDMSQVVSVTGALRAENYSDFGGTLNYKLGTKFQLSPNFSLRGTVSSGFRAPSLQQRYFNSTYTDFIGGVASDVVITPNDGPIAQALGIPSLKEETSTNYTAGFTARLAKGLTLTVDAYSIDIRNRIVLTGYFGADDPDIGFILQQARVEQASFFANAISTKTQGIDAVLSYRRKIQQGMLGIVLATNFNETKQQGAVQASAQLAGKEETYFGERERLFVEGSAPINKTNLTVNYDVNNIGFMLRGNYFGKVTMGTWSGGGLTQTYKPKTVLDASIYWRLNSNLTWTVGGANLLNAYPDKQNPDETESGGLYESVQMGFNGTYFFTRLKLNF
jgi:iron complex outermembrane recepter protein